ncbi:MAG TPA: low specificity L-threonine aldolase [Steroidobacteraceae bacterium]|jgi:threonine aldolase|nr:low specificity L-threonine aldolase [Steroidobacteraceae bacterium]
MNTTLSRNFGSDNVTPACAPVMAAINAANTGLVASYGADEFTARLQIAASKLFEREVSIYPVATGTAANALALAQLAPPFGGIYCHAGAHIVTDECGAPELFTGGAKLLGLPSPSGKIAPEAIEASVALANDMGVHHVKPSAVSVTQATELGTVYGLDELKALTAVARRHGLAVHMDGARFANAVVHLGCTAAEATWKAGVDVLSFGATKNGALAAEAVVFFDPRRAEEFERRRKQAGHLWSKLRYLSCQLLAYLEDDLWLRNARQANAMAARLGEGLGGVAGTRLLQPVQANELFVAVPERLIGALENEGFHFYRWPWLEVKDGAAIRLVTSYATGEADVDDFLRCAARLG